MERRDFLSAIPGLTIGAAGADLSRFLDDTPQTDWTVKGGESISPAKMRAIAKLVEEIEQWRRSHMGIDAYAAGPDYPHPSQKVRVLQFFDGNGRLDPSGIQFRVDPAIVGTYGLWWVPEYYDSSNLGSVAPYSRIIGDINETVADAFDVEIELFAYAKATPVTHSARLNISAVDPLAVTSSTTSIRGTVTNSGLISGSPFFELFIDDTDNRHFRLAAVPLYLAAETADFATLSDGMLWYRTDTDKFRARANGVTENLATEAYVTTAIAAIPADQDNIWPYAAKTTTYTTLATDGFIRADATGGSFVITLLTAVGNAGLIQVVKKIDATNNTVTVDANTTQTLDGVLTYVLGAEDESVTFISDGANWQLFGTYERKSYAAKTTTYTVLQRDEHIAVDAAGGAFTVTLYAVAGNAGRTITFVKTTAANTVTIDGSGAETIRGLATYGLSAQYSYVTLLCTGAAWLVIGEG